MSTSPQYARCLTLLAVWILCFVIFGISVVQGDSMRPAYHQGDLVVYARLMPGGVDYGDAVILKDVFGKECIKRIVGLSGDQIVMDDTGRIYRNGALVIFCVYRLFRFLYKEISLKIAKISEETTKLSRYVYAIDRGMGEFAKGNLTARGNIKFLGDFASIQNSILVFADKIKDAIEKIRGGVNDISEMVLTSSAASQENAAASEELATQAQLLKELIENFKVDE